ncbi:MAG: hypothetical protein SGI72_13180 [Planctomycetota bacterium]|nr:hypothetical protein [Planctomycetota bacterium]
MFFDIKMTSLDPEGATLAADLILDMLEGESLRAVGGLGACATDLQIPGNVRTISAESTCMGQIFEPYEPDQAHLFPASPKDWLPEGHLSHFISDTVDELDVEPFLAKYGGREDGRGSLASGNRKLTHPTIES